jgi:hypothetical protein
MAILIISEYYNRMNIVSNGKINKVYGGLLGHNTGKKFEICYAFEILNNSENDNDLNLDTKFMEDRKRVIETSFPNYQILGFFTTNTSTQIHQNDHHLIKFMEDFGVVKPIALVLSVDLDVDVLPVAVYDYDHQGKNFITLEHIIESYDSERICMDMVCHSGSNVNQDSPMIKNMEILKNAISVLKDNLNIIKTSLSDPDLIKDPVYIGLLDELIKNYPSNESPDLIELLKTKEKEILILNNICSNSIDLSYQGKVDSVSNEGKFRMMMDY